MNKEINFCYCHSDECSECFRNIMLNDKYNTDNFCNDDYNDKLTDSWGVDYIEHNREL